jgi:hypothetical protein
MKKVLIFSFLFLVALFSARGATYQPGDEPAAGLKKGRNADMTTEQNADPGVVSTIDKVNFVADFGYIPDERWTKSSKYNEVTFIKNGQPLTAYFNTRGDIIGTTSIKKFSDLPASSQKVIKSRYSGYAIGDVIYFDDYRAESTDGILYGVKFQYPDNYFVEMTKGEKRIIVEVNPEGEVLLYKVL